MRSVRAARWAISTGGLVLAIDVMLWCSATQKRSYPNRSAACATSVAPRSASPDVPSSVTTASSRTDKGTRALIPPTYDHRTGLQQAMSRVTTWPTCLPRSTGSRR